MLVKVAGVTALGNCRPPNGGGSRGCASCPAPAGGWELRGLSHRSIHPTNCWSLAREEAGGRVPNVQRQRKFTEFSNSATKHSQGRGIEDGKIVSRSILLEVLGV